MYVKDNYFFLESKDLELDGLRITNHNEVTYFEKHDIFTWKIAARTVANILTPNQEDRAFIYYGDPNNQISLNDITVNTVAPHNLTASVDGQLINLYVSLDNYLRFMWNQHPSARSYYKSAEVTNVSCINKDTIQLDIVIVSKVFPLKSIDMVISSRRDSTQEIFTVINSKYTKSNDDDYANVFYIKFKPSEVFPKLIHVFDYDDYNLSIFDYWFYIEINEHPLTKYKFRLPAPMNMFDSIWCHSSKTEILVLYWYKTQLGNFSNRIGVLKKDSFLRFESEKNKKNIHNHKPIILIVEYPHKAQDNGFLFFKYLMDTKKDFTPYYIISKHSKDLINLEKYMDNVLIYKSPEHIEKFFEADFLAHTHTPNYALPVLTTETIKKRDDLLKIFLQHGVIGMRNLEYLYGRKSNPTLINKFIVSSQRELNIVRDELFYPEEDIKLTGLARFDSLLQGNNRLKSFIFRKRILIMPTWRQNQELLTDEEFKKTEFYNAFSDLINDQNFRQFVVSNKMSVSLYLHHNFQKYNHLFHSDFVNIIESGTVSVQQLLKENGILITDYSSVGLDFAIQKRTVMYYQFDQKLMEQRDIEKEQSFLPGPIFKTKKELIHAIVHLKNNKLDKEYEDIIQKNIYAYSDTNACKRTYMVLKECQTLLTNQRLK